MSKIDIDKALPIINDFVEDKLYWRLDYEELLELKELLKEKMRALFLEELQDNK